MAERRPLSVQNRTARHEFSTDDSLVAGVVLNGSQVKSIRAGKVDLTGAYVRVRQNDAGQSEAWVLGMTVGNETQVVFKLLVTKAQLSRLIGLSEQQHATIVVQRGHFVHGYFKLDIAVAKRLKRHDKRARLRSADLERDAERELAR